jgi:dihydroorotase
MNHFFKNIHAINPFESINERTNIWLKDGLIHYYGNEEPALDNNTELVDSTDLVCSPGFIDIHVHLREPGQEYKEDILSGTNAAKNGGFTAVVCMPNTSPTIDNPETIEYIKSKSKGLLTDVFISGSITQGRHGKQLSPMFELNEYGAVYFTDDGSCVSDSNVMRRAFEYASTKDLLLAQHCEDHSLTENFTANEGLISSKLGLKGYPSVAEEIIISRDIMLSEYLGNLRYHISHISTKGAIELVRQAKKKNLRVSCEVTPHHFSLNEEVLESYDTRTKMNPPLRTDEDINAVIEGLIDGTIDCIASDHAPHSLHEKHVEFDRAPHGIIGLETTIGLSLTYLYHKGHLTIEQIIDKLAITPRRLINLNEISFKKDSLANLTIFNINEEWTVNKQLFMGKSKNTPFNNFRLKGKPVYTVNNKQIHKSEL